MYNKKDFEILNGTMGVNPSQWDHLTPASPTHTYDDNFTNYKPVYLKFRHCKSRTKTSFIVCLFIFFLKLEIQVNLVGF